MEQEGNRQRDQLSRWMNPGASQSSSWRRFSPDTCTTPPVKLYGITKGKRLRGRDRIVMLLPPFRWPKRYSFAPTKLMQPSAPFVANHLPFSSRKPSFQVKIARFPNDHAVIPCCKIYRHALKLYACTAACICPLRRVPWRVLTIVLWRHVSRVARRINWEFGRKR